MSKAILAAAERVRDSVSSDETVRNLRKQAFDGLIDPVAADRRIRAIQRAATRTRRT